MNNTHLAIIGGGNMGRALIGGLLRRGTRPEQISVGESVDAARQRAWFARLRQLLQSLNDGGARLDTLSMGMSADFEAAILEGATIVRVGTALFGPRLANTPPHTGGGRAPPATGTIGAA